MAHGVKGQTRVMVAIAVAGGYWKDPQPFDCCVPRNQMVG